MIAVDTSALIAILAKESAAARCRARLHGEESILISAGTVAEALIVAGRRNVGPQMAALIEEFGCDVIPVTAAAAARIGDIYRRWGKGVHAAGLNLGDCFAYEVAAQHACPLLYVGEDFARTDIAAAV